MDEKIITIQTKKGRTFLTCSCQNHGVHPIEGFCYHKELAVLFPTFEHFDKKLKEILMMIDINKLDSKNIKILLNDLRR